MCVCSLFQHGGDVTKKDKNELTPLHAAVMGVHLETAYLLVDLGADPHASDAGGCTPVVLAIAVGMPEVYFLGRATSAVS